MLMAVDLTSILREHVLVIGTLLVNVVTFEVEMELGTVPVIKPQIFSLPIGLSEDAPERILSHFFIYNVREKLTAWSTYL